jgi:hypothetical protein
MADMEVDYGALVWQQRLALKNMPAGYTRIVLSAEDLGHFMTHPIFMQVAASAINVSVARQLRRPGAARLSPGSLAPARAACPC